MVMPFLKSEAVLIKIFTKALNDIRTQAIYVTEVHDDTPALRCGLCVHDKILQCNGYNFMMVTHKKAVNYIKKHPVLNVFVARKVVTQRNEITLNVVTSKLPCEVNISLRSGQSGHEPPCNRKPIEQILVSLISYPCFGLI